MRKYMPYIIMAVGATLACLWIFSLVVADSFSSHMQDSFQKYALLFMLAGALLAYSQDNAKLRKELSDAKKNG